MLPDEAVEEFKELYKKEYNIELSMEDARKLAQNLYGLIDAVYGEK